MKKYAIFRLVLLTYNLAQASENISKSPVDLQFALRLKVLEERLNTSLSKIDQGSVENSIKENFKRLTILNDQINAIIKQQEFHKECLHTINEKIKKLEFRQTEFEQLTQSNIGQIIHHITSLEATVTALATQIEQLRLQKNRHALSTKKYKTYHT